LPIAAETKNRKEKTMTEINMDLVRKGVSEPREGLRDQGLVSGALADKYETELVGSGWEKEETVEMKTLTQALGTKAAEKAEAARVSKQSTVDEGVAVNDAKEIIGKVRLAAPIVVRKNPEFGYTIESFQSGGSLGRSTPKITMFLEAILPPVTALDEKFKPFFAGKSAAALIKEAIGNLDTAQSTQEVNVAALPNETKKIYETKGRLLILIEEFNRIAKIAFWNRTDLAAQFNKDVLNRARKTRKNPDRENPPATEKK
jgi:hypothetical protein